MKSLQTSAPVLAVLTAIICTAAGGPAAAAICPQYVAEYCVVEKDGFRHTDWTNPCFAAERGARVLHLGACQGPICSDIFAPVCSINPITHWPRTYPNQCVSDVANATLLYKGRCRWPR